MKGTLYGVGVGPGDPELLTLKAARLLRETEIIAVPGREAREAVAYRIAVQAVPEIADKLLIAVDMPMTRDTARLGLPLAEGEEPLHILPAARFLRENPALSGALVLMKPAGQMGEVRELLRQRGRDAFALLDCGMETERVCPDLDALPEDAGYFTLLIRR